MAKPVNNIAQQIANAHEIAQSALGHPSLAPTAVGQATAPQSGNAQHSREPSSPSEQEIPIRLSVTSHGKRDKSPARQSLIVHNQEDAQLEKQGKGVTEATIIRRLKQIVERLDRQKDYSDKASAILSCQDISMDILGQLVLQLENRQLSSLSQEQLTKLTRLLTKYSELGLAKIEEAHASQLEIAETHSHALSDRMDANNQLLLQTMLMLYKKLDQELKKVKETVKSESSSTRGYINSTFNAIKESINQNMTIFQDHLSSRLSDFAKAINTINRDFIEYATKQKKRLTNTVKSARHYLEESRKENLVAIIIATGATGSVMLGSWALGEPLGVTAAYGAASTTVGLLLGKGLFLTKQKADTLLCHSEDKNKSTNKLSQSDSDNPNKQLNSLNQITNDDLKSLKDHGQSNNELPRPKSQNYMMIDETGQQGQNGQVQQGQNGQGQQGQPPISPKIKGERNPKDKQNRSSEMQQSDLVPESIPLLSLNLMSTISPITPLSAISSLSAVTPIKGDSSVTFSAQQQLPGETTRSVNFANSNATHSREMKHVNDQVKEEDAQISMSSVQFISADDHALIAQIEQSHPELGSLVKSIFTQANTETENVARNARSNTGSNARSNTGSNVGPSSNVAYNSNVQQTYGINGMGGIQGAQHRFNRSTNQNLSYPIPLTNGYGFGPYPHPYSQVTHHTYDQNAYVQNSFGNQFPTSFVPVPFAPNNFRPTAANAYPLYGYKDQALNLGVNPGSNSDQSKRSLAFQHNPKIDVIDTSMDRKVRHDRTDGQNGQNGQVIPETDENSVLELYLDESLAQVESQLQQVLHSRHMKYGHSSISQQPQQMGDQRQSQFLNEQGSHLSVSSPRQTSVPPLLISNASKAAGSTASRATGTNANNSMNLVVAAQTQSPSLTPRNVQVNNANANAELSAADAATVHPIQSIPAEVSLNSDVKGDLNASNAANGSATAAVSTASNALSASNASKTSNVTTAPNQELRIQINA